jgi:hypothetical protein
MVLHEKLAVVYVVLALLPIQELRISPLLLKSLQARQSGQTLMVEG